MNRVEKTDNKNYIIYDIKAELYTIITSINQDNNVQCDTKYIILIQTN